MYRYEKVSYYTHIRSEENRGRRRKRNRQRRKGRRGRRCWKREEWRKEKINRQNLLQ